MVSVLAVVIVVGLSLWALAQAGRIGLLAALLAFAGTALAVGLWLVLTKGAGEIDVVYGFGSGDGHAPTILLVTRPQYLGAGLIWLSTMLVAAVLGHRLLRSRTSTTD